MVIEFAQGSVLTVYMHIFAGFLDKCHEIEDTEDPEPCVRVAAGVMPVGFCG